MKRFAVLTTILTGVLVLLLPFIGGGGPSIGANASSATAAENTLPIFASSTAISAGQSTAGQSAAAGLAAVHTSETQVTAAAAATVSYLKQDTEHLAQKPVPIPAPPVQTAATAHAAASYTPAQRKAARAAAGQSCPTGGGGGGSAPGGSDGQGATGTTTADIQSFSATFNAIRIANCLDPIPASNFRYDSCMEQRLYWMAEDPSTDPGNTWGHAGVHSTTAAADGTYYSDTTPSRGCDGNLAGGSGNSGATVAQKWWDSMDHRLALYKPSYSGSTAGVCIFFAMTHGGVPNEPSSFTRAAARWAGC
jgi:hypothetical protein